MPMRFLFLITFLSLLTHPGFGGSPVSRQTDVSLPAKQPAPKNYVLGPDDQITLSVNNLEEVSGKPLRVDRQGDLNLPLIGRVHVEGLTTDQLETELDQRLKPFLNSPNVIVNVSDFRSQPVSILGEVGTPGIHQLEGHKTLYEMLSIAGGLRPDSGNSVRITRDLTWGRIPLPTAHDDPTGKYSLASVSIKKILSGDDPTENVLIKPEDTITVPKADLIYVIGSVKKPGGYVLGQEESLSTLQVLSLAEGLEKTAAGSKARIMRTIPGMPRRSEIPINLNKLMAGKVPDPPLKSDDILFVPNSAAKSAMARGAEAAIAVGTGIAVYAHP